jgi:DNA gyrase/topoisomerase IV subunit B
MKEEKDRLSGEDTREGMTAIISIKHLNHNYLRHALMHV